MFPKGFKYGNQNACQEYLKISKMSHLCRTNFKERENVSGKQQLQILVAPVIMGQEH